MGTLLTVALLVGAAIAFMLLGRAESSERQLDLLSGGGAARLIEAELQRAPSLSREQAAKRALDAARRNSA